MNEGRFLRWFLDVSVVLIGLAVAFQAVAGKI
jgi:hypothetical protein